jgi:hypothetical protein
MDLHTWSCWATNELTNMPEAHHSKVSLRWQRRKFSLPRNREQKKIESETL